MITVKNIYDSLSQNELMLSNYPSEFWSEYIHNHTTYDRIFTRLYRSFSPWEQDENDSIEYIKDNFITAVRDILKLYDKEFSELYKIHILDSDAYDIINDFSRKEVMDRDTMDSYGMRNDSFSNSKGSQSDSYVERVAPYDSNNFNENIGSTTNQGSRNDSGSSTKGSQDDVHTEDYTLKTSGYNTNPLSNIKKHKDYWSNEDFYSYIFGVIAERLLIIS